VLWIILKTVVNNYFFNVTSIPVSVINEGFWLIYNSLNLKLSVIKISNPSNWKHELGLLSLLHRVKEFCKEGRTEIIDFIII
jgi:hypothetical protein